jgi:hypothetical protein
MSRPRIRLALIVAPLIALVVAGLAFGVGRASDYLQTIDTYWRVHDDVLLPTEAGRRYIDLFWTYNYELIDLLDVNQESFHLGFEIIDDFEPPLRGLVDGRGDEVLITAEMVAQVEAYLDLLTQIGSPALKATIEQERARTPFADLVGMTFEQARLHLVGPPDEVYPMPTDSPFR